LPNLDGLGELVMAQTKNQKRENALQMRNADIQSREGVIKERAKEITRLQERAEDGKSIQEIDQIKRDNIRYSEIVARKAKEVQNIQRNIQLDSTAKQRRNRGNFSTGGLN